RQHAGEARHGVPEAMGEPPKHVARRVIVRVRCREIGGTRQQPRARGGGAPSPLPPPGGASRPGEPPAPGGGRPRRRGGGGAKRRGGGGGGGGEGGQAGRGARGEQRGGARQQQRTGAPSETARDQREEADEQDLTADEDLGLHAREVPGHVRGEPEAE